MLSIAIVDDKNDDIEILKKYISNIAPNYFNKIEIDTYNNGNQFNFDKEYDAIFLDIDMPFMNGIDLAKKINKLYKTNIVFITIYSQYMHLTFDAKPFHFIHKNFIKDEANYVLNLLFKDVKNKKSYLRYKDNLILFKNIVYIGIDDHICTIHTADRDYSLWSSLSSIYNQLDKESFIKINQSVIVNLLYVENLYTDKIILKNGIEFFISKKLIKQTRILYNEYLIKNL